MSIDKFFDALDTIADKAVGTLKDVHYPGKEEETPVDEMVIDAEVVLYPDARLVGLVKGPDGKGYYSHVFPSEHSTISVCGQNLPTRAFIRPLPSKGYLGNFCMACLTKLIALEAQSPKPLELTDGR